MTASRQRLGRRAEALVARELERRGWRIVERNARPTGIRGELDIVALHERELVIVEVKAGSFGTALGPVSPLEMVGPRKRARLRRLAAAWAREHRGELPGVRGLRIDVIGLRLDAAGRVAEWQHVRAAC
jgi:putative endonuclease